MWYKIELNSRGRPCVSARSTCLFRLEPGWGRFLFGTFTFSITKKEAIMDAVIFDSELFEKWLEQVELEDPDEMTELEEKLTRIGEKGNSLLRKAVARNFTAGQLRENLDRLLKEIKPVRAQDGISQQLARIWQDDPDVLTAVSLVSEALERVDDEGKAKLLSMIEEGATAKEVLKAAGALLGLEGSESGIVAEEDREDEEEEIVAEEEDDEPDGEGQGFGNTRNWFSANRRILTVVGGGAVVLLLVALVLLVRLRMPSGNGFPPDAEFPQPSVQVVPAVVSTEATPLDTRMPESPLAAGCQGGYMTTRRLPSTEGIGRQGTLYPDPLLLNPVGPKIVNIEYFVLELETPVPLGVVLVHTEEGAFFFPRSFFPIAGVAACTPFSQVPDFDEALSRLRPRTGANLTLVSGGWWTPIAWGLSLLLLLAAISEMMVKRQLRGVMLFLVLVLLTRHLQKFIPVDAQWALYLMGLICSLALGDRGALAEVDAAVRRAGQLRLPDEVQELVDPGSGIRQVVMAVDWSRPAWWAGINLVWGVVTPEGSPLHQQYGPLLATVLLGLQCLIFYGLEAWRRNRSGDWGAIGGALAGALVSTGLSLWLEQGSSTQRIALLITAMVVVLAIVLVGVSGQRAIERDRIPDGLAAFASFCLTGLLLVVRFVA